MVPLTIVVIVFLVLLSGFFSATETAYSCANRIKLKSMVASGKKYAEKVYMFSEDKYDKLITTILIGNNIVNLTAATLGAVLFEKLLSGSTFDYATVSTVVMTLSVLVFGEITPKFFASNYPEQCCFLFYPLIQFFHWILFPLSWLFGIFQTLLKKIFKVKSDDTVTDEELMSLVDEAEEDGTLKEDESELLRSALEFDDLKVEDILVPRVDVVAVDVLSSVEDVLQVFKENNYSRLPVYDGTIDKVVGLIHEKDLFSAYLKGETKLKNIVQDISFTTEYTRISTLLKQLQKEKVHMAVVSDEYGGMVGIATMEDILEELVGEIWDEHDEEEVLFGKVDESVYWVNGKCDLDSFFDLYGYEKDGDDFEANTVGGWVMELYGGIPPTNEVVSYKDLSIKVLKTTKQKVLKIRAEQTQTDGLQNK